MKKLVLAALILASTGLSGSAFARKFFFPGTVCQPSDGDTTSIAYNQYGIANTSGATITVECPLPLSYSTTTVPTMSAVVTTFYDRSTTSDVSCLLQQTDDSGNSLFGANVSTGGGGPGSSSNSFPFSFVVGKSAGNYWRMRCTLPGVESGAFSHLTSIIVTTSE